MDSRGAPTGTGGRWWSVKPGNSPIIPALNLDRKTGSPTAGSYPHQQNVAVVVMGVLVARQVRGNKAQPLGALL